MSEWDTSLGEEALAEKRGDRIQGRNREAHRKKEIEEN